MPDFFILQKSTFSISICFVTSILSVCLEPNPLSTKPNQVSWFEVRAVSVVCIERERERE